MTEIFKTDENRSGAAFSDDRYYRYALWRKWDATAPMIMFIGLNPSKANETEPDNTIRRVTDFSKRWGYGGFYMMNLFAMVSTNPDALLSAPDPVGVENDWWLKDIGSICKEVIFAWGSFKMAQERAAAVAKRFPHGKALMINSDGTPRHPLYVPSNTIPVLYTKQKSV